jgi:gliding motility-associated-like protein
MAKKLLTILIFISNISFYYTQIIFKQELFKGGVIGVGYSPSYNAVNFEGTFNLGSFPNNSTLKKAFLFSGQLGDVNSTFLNFNNQIIKFDSSTIISNVFYSDVYGGKSYVHCYDLTDFININQSIYTLKNITDFEISQNRFSDFYLYVEFYNSTFDEINSSIILNDKNFTDNINYNINNINKISRNKDVSLSLMSGYICDNQNDGEMLLINNSFFGLFGGNNLNSGICGGPGGNFYYYNGQLIGINNNNYSNSFYEYNVIADIKNHVAENDINLSLNYVSQVINNFTNSIWINFLTYTSNCSSFTYTHSPDTTICPNTPVPLFASGGSPNASNTGYQWLADGSVAKAAEVLSCTTCPNPVFSGSKSTLLTVQIWNNDSCSVVRPIKVNVRQKPAFTKFEITPSDCGTNNGKVSFLANQFINFSSIDNQAFTDALQYENLSAGQHSLQIEDAFTCKNDSLFLVPEQNLTNASYSPSPGFGYMPLEVAFLQQSSHATEYDWYINQTFFDELTSFTFDSSGVYTVELIAWQYDPSCADSFSLQILVYDNFSVSVPNIFTPNNDGSNDFFGITVSNEVEITYTIFNRWGNLITQGTETGKGFVKLWEGENVKDGTYFYQLSVTLKEKLLLPSEPNPNMIDESDFPMKLDGWVQVVR